MYKIVMDDDSHTIFEIETYKQTDIQVNPIEMKLFNNDQFNLNCEIIYSSVRLNKYNAGVLILNKTHGKYGTKFLYLCKPDDKRLPYFLVPFSLPSSFNKIKKDHYITFEFKNWNDKYPIGLITQNLGPVDDPCNFYEYMLYCKSLNISIQSFNQDVYKETKKSSNIIDAIIDKYNIPFRDDNVFTIDSDNSIDLDDGISIKGDIISIYIANVGIILEYLDLWGSFTNRISNIYLPDKRRDMLPKALAQMCSLNKGSKRICFVMDFNMITNETHLSVCYTIIQNNYYYNDPELLVNPDYIKLTEYYTYKNSKEIVTILMIKMNTECANYMKPYSNGIYKILKNENENMNNSDYEVYNDSVNYTHITSPIRRLVDILNMYQLSINEKIFQFGDNAARFYNKWLNKIDYINVCARNIRKVQSKCKILAICENHAIYKGKIFDKIIINNKYKYNYQVFLTDLKVYCKLLCDTDLNELDEYNFKLFIFNDESQLKKKIKIELFAS